MNTGSFNSIFKGVENRLRRIKLGTKFNIWILITVVFMFITVATFANTAPVVVQGVEEKTGIKWEMYHINSSTGLVSSLGRAYPKRAPGSYTAVSSASSAADVAYEFLLRLKEELGIANVSDIAVDAVKEYHYTEPGYADRDYSMIVRFHQVYNDIPVFDSFGLVAMTKYAEIYRLKHIWYTNITAPISPALSVDDVKQTARNNYGEPNIDFLEEPELYIMAPNKLVWWVKTGEPIYKDSLIDAITGIVISDWDNLVEQVPDGYCYIHGLVSGSTDGRAVSDEPLNNVEVKILDDDSPLPTETFWEGRTDNLGRYNETDPQSVRIWDGIIPGNNADLYCEAYLDDEQVDVRDGSIESHPLISARIPAETFKPDNQQTYAMDIEFDSAIQREAACVFREVRRGFAYSGKEDKVTVQIHHPDPKGYKAWASGNKITFHTGWATLPSDVILHEFGHTLMYEKYDNHMTRRHTSGHAGECPNNCSKCINHDGVKNDCSADAISEGWASYFAIAANYSNDISDTSFDWPAVSPGSKDIEINTNTDVGRKDEWSIVGILWDIHDGQNEADNDHLLFGGTTVSHIMMDGQPYTTKELYEDLYFEYPQSRTQLWEIFSNHGINDPDAPEDKPSNLTSSINGEIVYLGWDIVEDKNMSSLNQKIASGTMYIVQIDTTDQFNSPQEHQVAGNIFYIPLQPSTSYYWRVKAKDYAGHSGPWSETESFNTASGVIAKGLAWLRSQQNANGSWGTQSDYILGITQLATLAFFNYGVNESDSIDSDNDGTPDIREAMDYILARVQLNGGIYDSSSRATYCTAIGILTLVAADQTNNPPKYYNEIENARNFLLGNQNIETNTLSSITMNVDELITDIQNAIPENTTSKSRAERFLSTIQTPGSNINAIDSEDEYYGGWSYEPAPYGVADLSNTQWALMGLDAAYSYLQEQKPDPADPNTWTAKAVKFLERCQNHSTNDQSWNGEDGGFVYTPSGSAVCASTYTSYGSMTYAGIWSMLLTGLNVADTRIQAALDWAKDNYTVTDHPPTCGNTDLYYYYITMAKALAMTGQIQLDGHNWFEELSTELANKQHQDGYWTNPSGGREGQNPLVTAYALLSLETKTLPPVAKSWVSIILASNADLHFYDPQGRHVGKNYDTGEIESEIPGVALKVDPYGRHIINSAQLEAGAYTIELVGTGDGGYTLTIEGYRDDTQISSQSFTKTIKEGETHATDVVVSSITGALTIHIEEPKEVPGGLTAVSGDTVIDLTWSPIDDPDLLGYKVHYGTSTRSYDFSIDVGNNTSYQLTGLTNGVTYYAALTAYYVGDKESDYSVEVFTYPQSPPVVSNIPDVDFFEGESDNSIDLDDYVNDPDNTDAEINWTYSGNTNIFVSINPNTHVVTFTAKAGWSGSENITFTGTDTAGASDDDTIIVTVIPVNIPSEYTVNHLNGQQIVIDSQLGDWDFSQDILPLSVSSWESLGGAWEGEDDLSAKLKIRYDKDNLYFALCVKDDEYVAESTKPWPWENDGIQVMIDVTAGEIPPGMPNGTTRMYNFSIKDGWHEETYSTIKYTYEVIDVDSQMRRDEGTNQTFYEWKFTKEMLSDTAAGFTSGMEIAFAIIVDDSDTDATGQGGWIGWGSHAIAYGKNPETMKKLKLFNEGVTKSGIINSPETWSDEVILTGDVIIASGGNVNIQPGTIVKVATTDDQAGGMDESLIELIVDGGQLSAIGEDGNVITFTSIQENPNKNKGDWYGIRFDKGSISLEYCNEEYGKRGLLTDNPIANVISHCSFKNNEEFGVKLKDFCEFADCEFKYNTKYGLLFGENASFQRCDFTMNGDKGLYGYHYGENVINLTLTDSNVLNNDKAGVYLYNHGTTNVNISGCSINDNNSHGLVLESKISNLSIDDCLLTDNGGTGIIVLFQKDAPVDLNAQVSNCTIKNNDKTGILMSSKGTGNKTANVYNCEIADNNGDGINSDTVLIKDCSITNNADNGISLEATTQFIGNKISLNKVGVQTRNSVNISGNDIFDNTDFELENVSEHDVIANNNYWGEPTNTQIKDGVFNLEKIFDKKDDSAIGNVLISEYSTETFYNPGANPDIAVNPTSWNYGDVSVGNYVDKTFIVSNPGDALLSVTDINLTGNTNFSIQSGGSIFNLGSGNTHNIVVRFMPSATGNKSATLTLTNNVTEKNPLDVALQGTGKDGSAVSIYPVVESPQCPQNEFWVDIKVGNESDPVTDMSGLSFVFNYSNTGIVDLVDAVVLKDGFLGSDILPFVIKDDPSGKVSIGITRIDGKSATGYGTVARITIKFNDLALCNQKSILSLTEIAATKSDGSPINLGSGNVEVYVCCGICVYPGDTNNDGIVNQADVLPLGLNWHTTGPAREPQSMSWECHYVDMWDPVNAAYADANGSGQVDQADVLPIGINWHQTHDSSPDMMLDAVVSSSNGLSIIADPLHDPGEAFWVDIQVGSEADPVDNLFG
ncbi:choice-of-anchor D domain-containing protein, partial [Candidatus Poribacteria bacterium]|nr:choice-of-anchor D domain-containing protein [Candidatus Poribacteria bacterium]